MVKQCSFWFSIKFSGQFFNFCQIIHVQNIISIDVRISSQSFLMKIVHFEYTNEPSTKNIVFIKYTVSGWVVCVKTSLIHLKHSFWKLVHFWVFAMFWCTNSEWLLHFDDKMFFCSSYFRLKNMNGCLVSFYETYH